MFIIISAIFLFYILKLQRLSFFKNIVNYVFSSDHVPSIDSLKLRPKYASHEDPPEVAAGPPPYTLITL